MRFESRIGALGTCSNPHSAIAQMMATMLRAESEKKDANSENDKQPDHADS